MDINELFKNPEFKNLEPETVELFKQMYSEMQDKNHVEQVGIFMKYHKRLAAGKPIAKEELDLMMDVLVSKLSQQERGVFEKIFKLLQ